MDKKKLAMTLPITGAFTWFGYHCGSGFASGTQIKVYVSKFGAMGLLAPIVAWICCTAFITIILEYSRLIQTKSYRDVASTIYWDNKSLGRVIILVWDIMVFFSMLVASGSCVAGFGTLLDELFGLPYFVGCAIFVVFMICLMCFGENVLDRLGKISTPLIILFIIVCVVGIVRGAPNLGQVLTTDLGAPSEPDATILDVIWSGFTYGCIQISFVHTACVIGGGFQSAKETRTMAIAGFIMNCGAMLFGSFAVLAFYPGNMESAMPLLDVVRDVTGPAGILLMVIYNFILIMAYITTAGALIAGGHQKRLCLQGGRGSGGPHRRLPPLHPGPGRRGGQGLRRSGSAENAAVVLPHHHPWAHQHHPCPQKAQGREQPSGLTLEC